MTATPSLVKGGLKLGGGQLTVQACSFLRSVILARLMSVQDYGVAAAFAMTLSLLEMISNVSADKLLIQATDGDEPAFQNTAHFVHVVRGFWNGLVLFVAAGLAARLFGLPHAIWGFRSLALLPIIRGFIHLDSNRVQREMRFGPAVKVDVVSNVAVTLLAYPLVAYFRNYVAMLWLLVIQAAISIIVSHWVAERPYGWTWQRCYTRRMFRFGWPLLINGLLLYGIMQGDRVIIGSAKQLFPHATYTLADLGVYSVVFSLTMAPTMFMGNVTTSLFLPILSRARKSFAGFQAKYVQSFNGICLIVILTSVPFIAAGPAIVTTIYGTKYAPATQLIGWLAAMWGLRTLRTVPTIATLAHADTAAGMNSNIVRSLALVGVLWAAATGASLQWVAVSGLIGELLAFALLLFRLKRLCSIGPSLGFRNLGFIGFGMAITAATSALPAVRSDAAAALSVALLMTAALIMGMLYMLPQLRRDLRTSLESLFLPLRPKRA